MNISFIHTSNWQIGKQLANQHKADATLVAGDVFHTNEVSDTNIRKTLNTMQKYHVSWVLLRGNHNPSIPSPKKLRRIHHYA